MLKLYISLILLVPIQIASAQQPVLQWAKAFNSRNLYHPSQYSNGRSVGIDQQGNVYSTGEVHYTLDFDPGPGEFTLTGGLPYQRGIYVSKLDRDGNFVWAVEITAVVDFGYIELKVDKNGNVYLISELREPTDMDPGPGVQMMTPIGATDAFILKLDANGNLVWAKQFGGPGDVGLKPSIIDLDKDNNLVICGLFNSTVDFDPGPGTFNLTATAGAQSFIVKLSNSGNLIWAKQFGTSSNAYNNATITDVKCDAVGNILTTGGFKGTCDFDPGTAVYNLTSKSIIDGFIAKWTADGNFVWAKCLNNTTTEYNHNLQPRGIAIDSRNNVITIGYFDGAFDFDPGPGVQDIAGRIDCYIHKLNEQGDLVWVKIIKGNSLEYGSDVVVDDNDNIYATGSFGSSLDYDPGPGDHTITTPNHDAGALIKLNSSGNFVYAAPFPGVSYGTSFPRRMEIDPDLNIYITGHIAGTVDFDPGPNVVALTGSPSYTPFVVKFSPCMNRTASTLYINACNNYTLNHETFDATATYTQIIPNMAGCDSVITLHLTINKKFTQQTKTICEGEFFFAGGANQTASGTFVDTLQTVLGCDSIVTTYLTVHPKPLPNLGPDKNLCTNTALDISPGSFTSYLWHDMSHAGTFTITTPGTYWVQVTNSFGCSSSDTLTVPAILPVPSNFLKETDSICTYGSQEVRSLNPYATYQWSTGATERVAMVQQPGIYWLTVTDVNGCSGTDSITLFAKQCLSGCYIPSAFTPNGDGKNDVFKPLLFGKVKQYRFMVFNRWGAVVFQTTDPQKGWDGKIADTFQSNTVFVWTCHYQFEGSAPKVEKGTVTLIR
jgi:gliding motility-associated-like protein